MGTLAMGRAPEIFPGEYRAEFLKYAANSSVTPLLLLGEAEDVLKNLPSNSIDCVMTSPPYWGKREYANGGLGLEDDYRLYIARLCAVFKEVHRVLRDSGSLWLNIGDTYKDKKLLGIPWRVALELTDSQNWILRNSVIWNKVKSGMDNSRDRLGNVHENVFHFVKQVKDYYYNADAIRSTPGISKVKNGKVVSSTGVSGVKYKRQIQLSTELSIQEQCAALEALEKTLTDVANGLIADFRMIIRGSQRTTHSDSEGVSGRAKELHDKGFYILRHHPNGTKPSDVWDIIPEDTQRRVGHFAPYPADLCRIPILATCPPGGTMLDPFVGTGTTLYVAMTLGRKSVGIDLSELYLKNSSDRCTMLS